MLGAVRAAVDAAVAAVRPGTLVGDVTGAARGHRCRGRTGRVLVGLLRAAWSGRGAARAAPRPGGRGDDGNSVPGMVLCIEPGVAVPGIGAVILEEMVHVTTDGAEVLNHLPLELWDDS